MVITKMKFRRIELGLSQEEASLKLGISQSYLSKIENHLYEPSEVLKGKIRVLYQDINII